VSSFVVRGPRPPPVDEIGVSDQEAEEMLSLFRDKIMMHMPCIDLSQHETAPSLKREKPMVYLAIMCAASYHDLALQTKINRLIIGWLEEQKFKKTSESQKSLHMLQGMLIHLAWYGVLNLTDTLLESLH